MKHKAINKTPIGEIIRKRLEDKGMTQVELSRLTRTSTPTMNDIIQGRRSISPKHIISLALVLGLDAIELGRMQSDYEIISAMNPILENENSDE
jgi:plasmid maintenance system antidote protein VapI